MRRGVAGVPGSTTRAGVSVGSTFPSGSTEHPQPNPYEDPRCQETNVS